MSKLASAGGAGGDGGFPRRDEFQKYLEKSGVIDHFTRLLVTLYENPERPENALDFIASYMGAADASKPKPDEEELPGSGADSAARIAELESTIADRDSTIAELKRQLAEATGGRFQE